jgi:hypothetical protein
MGRMVVLVSLVARCGGAGGHVPANGAAGGDAGAPGRVIVEVDGAAGGATSGVVLGHCQLPIQNCPAGLSCYRAGCEATGLKRGAESCLHDNECLMGLVCVPVKGLTVCARYCDVREPECGDCTAIAGGQDPQGYCP